MEKYILTADDAEHFCKRFNSFILKYGNVSIHDLFTDFYLLGTFEHDHKYKDNLFGWDKTISIDKMFKSVKGRSKYRFSYELTLPEAKFLN